MLSAAAESFCIVARPCTAGATRPLSSVKAWAAGPVQKSATFIPVRLSATDLRSSPAVSSPRPYDWIAAGSPQT